MEVPFVDLKAQYQSIKPEIDGAIARIIEQTAFVGGPIVREFEEAFAERIGAPYCIGCGNGTDSMEIILETMEIGPGDEVIVPANSWISTSEVVSRVGAKPVFVDVEPEHYTIDVNLIADKITSNTRAIIPVHLYGHPADMPAIMKIADTHDIKVIEDCAQAHLAAIEDKKVGTYGIAASFSFYPGKNLGAYGDAGCILTQDAALAARMRMLANHGQQGKHNHLIEGRNSRLDTMQAAILQAKLPFLEEWTERRAENAEVYTRLLEDYEQVKAPRVREEYRHVFHLYVVRVQNRDVVMRGLKNAGVQAAIHYPTALPLLPAYEEHGYTIADFPVAGAYQDEILSLPMYPELTMEQIEYVVAQLCQLTS